MAKNQLHQLLAVESELRNQAAKIYQETIVTFTKKEGHFDGMVRTYEPKIEGEDVTELPPEIKEVVTTVEEKLEHTEKALTKSIDAQLSKDETNANGTTRAEVVIEGDGEEMKLGEFSATSLLSLENTLTKIRALYDAIPTLDPAKKWEEDETRTGIYKTSEQVTYRTEKQPQVITLAPATKEHPAQTQLLSIDKQVGLFRVVYSSGRITPREKSEKLERIDRLIRAIKKARARANQSEVLQTKIARQIFSYINDGYVY